MLWIKLPLFKLTLSLMLGILFSEYFLSGRIEEYFFILGLLALFTLLLLGYKSWRKVFVFSSCLFFFLLGAFLVEYSLDNSSKDYGFDDFQTYIVEIREEFKPSKNYDRYKVEAYTLDSTSTVKQCFPLLLNSKKDSLRKALQIGDQLMIETKPYPLEKPPNPAQFDYSSYLSRQLIFHQAYIDEYRIVDSVSSLKRSAQKVRSYLLAAFDSSALNGENLGVMKALLLGDKQELDRQTRTAFATAGAMHILAVSGLHLGIIYLLFDLLFKTLRLRKKPWIRSLLLLLIIWGFALLTGLSPSVQRSALMFSMIIVSPLLGRRSNSLNAVVASAFLLLIIDPMLLFQAAFQLSYAAVLGILLIYPPLFAILKTEKKYLDKLISLLLVSLSAQLATLPFSLHYFHLFPNYFLLTNLFIVPLAFVIVSLGILSISLFLIFHRFYFSDLLLNESLSLLRNIAEQISIFPYAKWEAIWLEPLSILFLSMLIICGIGFLHSRKKSWLLSSASMIFFIVVVEIVPLQRRANENELTIYSFSNAKVVSIRKGLDLELIVLDSLSSYEEQIIQDHLHSMGIMNFRRENLKMDQALQHNYWLRLDSFEILMINQAEQIRWQDAELLILNESIAKKQFDSLKDPSVPILIYSYENSLEQPYFNLRKSAFRLSF